MDELHGAPDLMHEYVRAIQKAAHEPNVISRIGVKLQREVFELNAEQDFPVTDV
jgi:hypothetical protein